jgi:hypothetical protein
MKPDVWSTVVRPMLADRQEQRPMTLKSRKAMSAWAQREVMLHAIAPEHGD